MRLLPLGLLLGLAASPALATGLEDMTEAERAAFRAEVRTYLLENPEVLIEAMDVLRAREEGAAAARETTLLKEQADAIFNDPNSWVGGNPSGNITIVEFVDYRCGYCRKAHDEVAQLIASDGDIRLIMKEYPILGEQSILSSKFAIAVRQLYGDAAYKATHDTLITLRGDATPETLARVATDLGHDPAAIAARMDLPEVTSVIDANHQLGTLMDISGTPTFIIDDTFIRGYLPLDDMRAVVEEQRKG